jgi:hypothetical protein
MPKIKSDVECLALCLALAVIAPSEEHAADAAEMAERMASHMPEDVTVAVGAVLRVTDLTD